MQPHLTKWKNKVYSVLQSTGVYVGCSVLSTYFKNRKSVTKSNLCWTAMGLPLISVSQWGLFLAPTCQLNRRVVISLSPLNRKKITSTNKALFLRQPFPHGHCFPFLGYIELFCHSSLASHTRRPELTVLLIGHHMFRSTYIMWSALYGQCSEYISVSNKGLCLQGVYSII